MNIWVWIIGFFVFLMVLFKPMIDGGYIEYKCWEDLPYTGEKSYRFYKGGGMVSEYKRSEGGIMIFVIRDCDVTEGERFVTHLCENRNYKIDKWDLSLSNVNPTYCKTRPYFEKWSNEATMDYIKSWVKNYRDSLKVNEE